MKTIFIPVKIKTIISKSQLSDMSKRLPKNIAIAYSIQYIDMAKEIKSILTKKHNITKFIQVLGCSKPRFSKNTSAILLIGDGRFHAISLAYGTKLPVYIYRTKLERILPKDIDVLKRNQKAAYMRFLNANKVGVLISTKPGQENLKKAIGLKKKLKKNSYLFITNNIDTREFENFGLDSWVNTACPRLDMNDNSVVNMNKVQ
ncbi:putative diphthamide synthesis protein [archaeon BMS3Abin17]|nr:putative diphthamide synthesis protein [archaeon BMS3Abin17]HDZ61024.1 hypothetical protein [Candidatus Pacearchaeota archaeon]